MIPCEVRYRACTSVAAVEVRTGVGPFRSACEPCAAGKRRWAASPGMSGLRFESRPLRHREPVPGQMALDLGMAS